MRTLVILASCLAPQGEEFDRAVARIVERLSEDQVEARDKAVQELIALGTKALPAIRRRSEAVDVEVRERLLSVAREIERLDRMNFFLGQSSRISLKAERMPIKSVLAELAKQTTTPVVLKEMPDEVPISIELKDAPFFHALQEICRAHSGILMRLPGDTYSLEDRSPVELVRGNPRACSRYVEGPFVVDLESVYVSESSDFQGKREETISLNLVAGWEHGIRPIGMRFRVTSVVDGQGTAYKVASSMARDDRMDIYIWRRTWVTLDKVPPASVTSFKEIAGVLELDFPSDGHVARVDGPLGKRNVEAPGGPASFTLEEFVRDGPDRVRATVETASTATEKWLERVRFFAIDAQGRIYPQEGGRGRGTVPGKMRWTFAFEIPGEAEVKELRAVRMLMEKGRTFERRINWKLLDVHFR